MAALNLHDNMSARVRRGVSPVVDVSCPACRYRFHASNLSEFGETRPRHDAWYKVYVMKEQLSCCCQWAMYASLARTCLSNSCRCTYTASTCLATFFTLTIISFCLFKPHLGRAVMTQHPAVMLAGVYDS